MPMVNQPTTVIWSGMNGLGSPINPITRARKTAYTVLLRNSFATRSMFPITRRPSATTCGRVANRSSSSTICATARVAGEPEPIATPRSASLSASTSLTPSPVMATVCPRDCRAETMARFCCGVTRPNTSAPATFSVNSSPSAGRVRASTASATETPSDRVTAPTEAALSPEITFTATCWSLK